MPPWIMADWARHNARGALGGWPVYILQTHKQIPCQRTSPKTEPREGHVREREGDRVHNPGDEEIDEGKMAELSLG